MVTSTYAVLIQWPALKMWFKLIIDPPHVWYPCVWKETWKKNMSTKFLDQSKHYWSLACFVSPTYRFNANPTWWGASVIFMGFPPTMRSSPFQRNLEIGDKIVDPEIHRLRINLSMRALHPWSGNRNGTWSALHAYVGKRSLLEHERTLIPTRQ